MSGSDLTPCVACGTPTPTSDGGRGPLCAACARAGVSATQAPGAAGGGLDQIPIPPGYEILGELGRGAMGAVFKARDERLDRIVALKYLTSTDPGLGERFHREARILSRLRHPGIVELYSFDETTGWPLLIVEFVDGRTLADMIEAEGRLPVARALPIARGILEGLAHAHDAGVIHRDLKSENVLLTRENHPKIADFGIAACLDMEGARTRMTRTGVILGTPAYMAPEQAKGEHADHRADLYAIGIILYEMVTGTLPFVALNPFDVLRMHITDRPVPPADRAPGLSPDLSRLIASCLEKDPARRPGSAHELLSALKDPGVLRSTRRIHGPGSGTPGERTPDDASRDPGAPTREPDRPATGVPARTPPRRTGRVLQATIVQPPPPASIRRRLAGLAAALALLTVPTLAFLGRARSPVPLAVVSSPTPPAVMNRGPDRVIGLIDTAIFVSTPDLEFRTRTLRPEKLRYRLVQGTDDKIREEEAPDTLHRVGFQVRDGQVQIEVTGEPGTRIHGGVFSRDLPSPRSVQDMAAKFFAHNGLGAFAAAARGSHISLDLIPGQSQLTLILQRPSDEERAYLLLSRTGQMLMTELFRRRQTKHYARSLHHCGDLVNLDPGLGASLRELIAQHLTWMGTLDPAGMDHHASKGIHFTDRSQATPLAIRSLCWIDEPARKSVEGFVAGGWSALRAFSRRMKSLGHSYDPYLADLYGRHGIREFARLLPHRAARLLEAGIRIPDPEDAEVSRICLLSGIPETDPEELAMGLGHESLRVRRASMEALLHRAPLRQAPAGLVAWKPRPDDDDHILLQAGTLLGLVADPGIVGLSGRLLGITDTRPPNGIGCEDNLRVLAIRALALQGTPESRQTLLELSRRPGFIPAADPSNAVVTATRIARARALLRSAFDLESRHLPGVRSASTGGPPAGISDPTAARELVALVRRTMESELASTVDLTGDYLLALCVTEVEEAEARARSLNAGGTLYQRFVAAVALRALGVEAVRTLPIEDQAGLSSTSREVYRNLGVQLDALFAPDDPADPASGSFVMLVDPTVHGFPTGIEVAVGDRLEVSFTGLLTPKDDKDSHPSGTVGPPHTLVSGTSLAGLLNEILVGLRVGSEPLVLRPDTTSRREGRSKSWVVEIPVDGSLLFQAGYNTHCPLLETDADEVHELLTHAGLGVARLRLRRAGSTPAAPDQR